MTTDLIKGLKARYPEVSTEVLSEIAQEAILTFASTTEISALVARGGGDALPWSVRGGGVFPLSARGGGDALPWSLITTTVRKALDLPGYVALKASENAEHLCRELAQTTLSKGEALPATKSFSLYLLRCLIEGTVSGKATLGVAFPPEFLFILDVGYEALVGVSFLWSAVLSGDPTFPDESRAAIRSIPALDEGSLLYPNIAGSLIVKIADGVPQNQIVNDFESRGLWDLTFSGSTCFVHCPGFRERFMCSRLSAEFSYVKWAEPDRLVRLIDIVPGWSIVRLV